MANNKPYVRIQSNTTINVTAGLHNNDVTNPDAHVADRLKVNPLWPKMTCLIKQGVRVYPSDIVEWPAVKALQKDKVLTIGEYLDTPDDKAVETQKTQLNSAKSEIEKQTQKQTQTLADLAK